MRAHRLHDRIGAIFCLSILVSGVGSLSVTSISPIVALAQTDDVPPTIVSTFPFDGETDVLVVRLVFIVFDEQIDFSTVTPETFQVMNDNAIIEGEIFLGGTGDFLRFVPDQELEHSTVYSVLVTNDLKDLAGNSMESDYTFSFTTIEKDTVPPEVVSTFPADGATGLYGEGDRSSFLLSF